MNLPSPVNAQGPNFHKGIVIKTNANQRSTGELIGRKSPNKV